MKKEAMLWERLDGGRVRCLLCAHHCNIAEGKVGVCRVRRNEGGTLFTSVYGEVIAAHVDPIEKKPLYHFQPGSTSFSVATLGCNFQCSFCQNWEISQRARLEKVRDTRWGRLDGGRGEKMTPQRIIELARRHNCSSISYTYTEPTIFLEYAAETGRLAHRAGLRNNFVTNGYMTQAALEEMRDWLDAANVDLKSFRDSFYKKHCKARLQPVLDSIRKMKELGIWVEVTTLVIPGENDSPQELEDIAEFIASVGVEIPWHVSRFHPDYQLTDRPLTPLDTLRAARHIGRSKGLRYVYLGNVGEGGETACWNCGRILIRRSNIFFQGSRLRDGACPDCGVAIDGRW